MSLQIKILSILVLAVVLYAALSFVMQQGFILPSFVDLEQKDARHALQRSANALRREIYHLNQLCSDWAAWDDTYNFIVDPNPEYENSNLVPTSFSENNLNLIFFFNLKGEVVWGKTYGFQFRETVTPPEFAARQWPPDHRLLTHRDRESSVSGLLMTAQGPMLIASRPILPSIREGEIRGTLVMGRYLSDTVALALRDQAQTDLTLWPLDGRELPPAAASELAFLSPEEPARIRETEENRIEAYATFPDLYGAPALLMRVSLPRDILSRGLVAMRLNILAVSCVGVFVLLVLIILMQRTVARPIAALTRHMTRIGREEELTAYTGPQSRDEVGTLAREFNRMIQRLGQDRAKRTQAEDALRESEAWIHTILFTAPDGIITAGPDGRIESVNLACSRIFGYSPEEFLGRPIQSLATESVRPIMDAAIQGVAQTGKDQGFAAGRELTGLRKDGSLVPLHIRVSAVRAGDCVHVIGIVRDISDLKAMQERIISMERLATVGEMGASLAHEIRNPLTGISTAVQVIVQDLPPDHKNRTILLEVLDMVARVEQIVRQVLELSRQWSPQRRPCNVLELIRDACDETAKHKACSGITFEFPEHTGVVLLADPTLVQQVLVNLTINAVEAMPGGGTVVWAVLEEKEHITLRLRDTGCGMSEATLKNAVRPFFTTRARGTGLGLSICQRIMEAHGGAIALASSPGQGTEVTLTFPKGE